MHHGIANTIKVVNLKMGQKIFCISLSRNGTTSFHNYMKSFGIKSIHYPRVLFTQMNKISLDKNEIPKMKFSLIGRQLLKRQVQKENKINVWDVLDQNDAFSDLPINLLYRDLSRIYPNALFILTEREPKKWLKSMKWLLEERALFPIDHLGMLLNYVTYKTISYDEEKLLKTYSDHRKACKEFFKDNKNFYVLNLDKGELNSKNLCQILKRDPLEFKIEKKYPSTKTTTWVLGWYKFIRWIDFFDIIRLLYKVLKKYS